MAAENSAVYAAIPPPQPAAAIDSNNAFQDALKRAKEIAARIGNAPPATQDNSVGNVSIPDTDVSRKRSLEDVDENQSAKKFSTDGFGVSAIPEGTDPKSIAMQVAASIAQRAGLGSMPTEEIKIPNKFVGLIIGRGGEQINKLQSETGARIQVAPDPPPGLLSPPDRAVTVTGSAQAVENAKNLINKICEEGKVPEQLMSVPIVAPGEIIEEVMIPASKVGLIIGKGGETIKSLQERAQCRMVMVQDGPYTNAPEKPLRIMGDQQRCQRGKDLVQDLLTEKELEGSLLDNQRGKKPDFMNNRTSEYGTPLNRGDRPPVMQGPGGAKTIEYPVPRDVVGFVIGKNGETIKRIQAESGAKVQFHMKDNSNAPERLATIQGSDMQIQKVENMIREIIDQSKQRGGPPPRGPPPNMPGIQIREYPVPGNRCGLVIGKGGETIRQIIKVTGAYVELNRQCPDNAPTKYFVMRGTEDQIRHAEQLIREKIEGDTRGGGPGNFGGNQGGPNWNQHGGAPGGGGGGGPPGGNWNQNQNQPWQQPFGQQQQQQPPQQQQQQQQQFGQQQQQFGQQPFGQQPQQPQQQPPFQQQFGQPGQQQPMPQQQQQPQPQQNQQPGAPTSQAAGQPAQPDYSAAWAAYYQQLYQQQAAVAAAAATGQTPASTAAGQTTQTATTQPDYSAAWAEYYRQQGYYYPYGAQPAQPGQPQPGAPGQLHQQPQPGAQQPVPQQQQPPPPQK